jgi:hypothetical protein
VNSRLALPARGAAKDPVVIANDLVLVEREYRMQRSFAERRRHRSRVQTDTVAKLMAAERSPPVLCIIREVSPAGAKLELFKSEVIPTGFWLKLDGGTSMYYCSVKWMEGLSIGIEVGAEHREQWWQHAQRLVARKRKSDHIAN